MGNYNDYKIVIALQSYGDLFDYCFNNLDENENIDILSRYIEFNYKFEEKIYNKHFTKKMWLPFRKMWNHRYFKTKFNEDEKIIFIICVSTNIVYKYGAVKKLKRKYKNSKFVLLQNDLIERMFTDISFNKVLPLFDFGLSFDFGDCKKYNLIYHPLVYSAPEVLEQYDENIDVYFCGVIKDRLDLIMAIFKKLKSMNLKCLFILRGVPINKRENIDGLIYIDKFMPYKDNVDNIKRSKCLLEIMQKNGTGYTLRTCEAVAFNKKLMTNNPVIEKADFYNESMILKFNNIEEINADFILGSRKEYFDRNYFSPQKLISKVIDNLERIDDENEK